MELSRELLGSCNIDKLSIGNSRSQDNRSHEDRSQTNQVSQPAFNQAFQPQYNSNKRSYSTIIESFMCFCRDFGCDAEDSALSLKKAIVASIRSVNVKVVIDNIDPSEAFLDYNLLAQNDENNRFGDDMEWIKMMDLLHFDVDSETMMQDIKNGVLSINFLINLVQQMDMGAQISTNNMLKMYLLTNIKQVTSRHVLELFCSNLLHRDVSREVLILTSLLADQRFDQDQFTTDVSWLLQHLRFDDIFIREYQFFMKNEQSLKSVMKQRQIQSMARDRVRLRDRIPKATNMKWKTKVACSAESQEALDSFNGWVARVRFPQITTRRMKLNAYFIKCQTNLNHDPYVQKHYIADVAEIIIKNNVTIPETCVIKNVIDSLRMHVQPFPELIEFRRECFAGFAQKDSRGLTWLQILQLYVAAYQYAPIWTQCWTDVLPIISHQIICDVEKFTSTVAYNGEQVVDILIKS